MGQISAYALQAALILAIEYLLYKWLMSGYTFHGFNRAVIMSCYLMALIAAPMLGAGKYLIATASTTGGAIQIGQAQATMLHAAQEMPQIPWHVLPIVYFIGVVAMLLWTCLSYARLFLYIKSGTKEERYGYTLVRINSDISPFSWGRYVIVSDKDADNHLIIYHELAHIRHGHSLDLLVAQLFVIFNWFNPAAYLMRRELSAVQEYQADQQVLQSGVSPKEYQMLLIKKTVGSGFHSIANSLNHSQLKNRLTMMMKAKSKSVKRMAAAVLLPAAIFAASLCDIPAVAAVINNVKTASDGKVNKNSETTQIHMAEGVQIVAYANDKKQEVQTVDNPEVLPVYKGGEAEMYKVLSTNMIYPKEAQDAKAQGRVVVEFTVKTDGNIADVKIMKSAENASLDAEALRVVKEHLSTGWTPGKEKGKPVNCIFVLPITFRLQ